MESHHRVRPGETRPVEEDWQSINFVYPCQTKGLHYLYYYRNQNVFSVTATFSCVNIFSVLYKKKYITEDILSLIGLEQMYVAFFKRCSLNT